MNPKLAKLLYEGFSINTIEKLNDVQLSVLYSRISEQSSGTLNIPKADTASIEKAKSEKKPFVTYEEELGEEDVNEKSVSKKQHGLMGAAYSVEKGDKELKDIPKSYRGKVKKVVDSMSKKQVKDFAKTKTSKLPEKVDEVSKLEENILRILENHLPPHTTKGELVNLINRRKK
jgi:hypothetical protein